MEKRKRYIWLASGFLFVSLVGTLLHFLYEWSGERAFFALFSGVNESVWEHMKLFFFPAFIFALAEIFVFGDKALGLTWIKLWGILLGLVTIPALYYLYTGALGVSADWFNIAIFYIAVAVEFGSELLFSLRKRQWQRFGFLPIVILSLIAVAFFALTFYPVKVPIFRDPVTMQYGIK